MIWVDKNFVRVFLDFINFFLFCRVNIEFVMVIMIFIIKWKCFIDGVLGRVDLVGILIKWWLLVFWVFLFWKVNECGIGLWICYKGCG